MTPNRSDSACAQRIDDLADHNFATWSGLPTPCPLTEVLRRFPLRKPGLGRGRLGRREAGFTLLDADGSRASARVWLHTETEVLLIDTVPNLGQGQPVRALLDALGEPDAKRDYHWTTIPVSQGEWIYAARGLTLFLNTDHQTVVRVAVYAPSTVEAYEAGFQLHLARRRRPLRR